MKAMEKDTESIGTVQMKTDYAHSEVYSTTSEPPPVYMRRQSNSVKIAKIAAFTVILSSFVIGAFILGATYLQARASCNQLQILDNIMEKEMNYEQKQNTFKAEALLGNNDEHLQKEKPEETDAKAAASSETLGTDEVDNHHQVVIKMPLQMNPSDLVNAFMTHNDKSRMNCVVERRLTEEQIDEPSQKLNLPLGLNVITRPKKGQVTGERMTINCDSGKSDEEKDESFDDIKPMIIPIGRFNFMPPQMRPQPIPFGDVPRFSPLTHMPQQHMPPQMPMFRHHPDSMMMHPDREPMLPVPAQHEVPPPPPPMNQLFHPRPAISQLFNPRPMPDQENNDMEMPKIHIQIRRIPIQEILNDNKPEGELIRNVLNDLTHDHETENKPEMNKDVGFNGEHDSEESENESDEFPRIFNVLRSMMRMPVGEMAKEEEGHNNPMMNKNEQPEHMEKENEKHEDNEKENVEPRESHDSEMMPMRIFPFPPMAMNGPQNSRIILGRSLLNPIRIPVPMDQEQADMKSTILNPSDDTPGKEFTK